MPRLECAFFGDMCGDLSYTRFDPRLVGILVVGINGLVVGLEGRIAEAHQSGIVAVPARFEERENRADIVRGSAGRMAVGAGGP